MKNRSALKSECGQPASISGILDCSLSETDFYMRASRKSLAKAGISDSEAKISLARHKSSAKYGYDLSTETLAHLLSLAAAAPAEIPLARIFEAPVLLMKGGWLYDHAPYFSSFQDDVEDHRNRLIRDFAVQYAANYLDYHVDFRGWEKMHDPRRVKGTTFWERSVIDPVGQIAKAREERIQGLELNFDFHPFNFAKLLPEEISSERRREIKAACEACGMQIDIHSPIIGPYGPCPDPATGAQLFFDPTCHAAVQYETIQLARDIGAGAVVFHLIDTSNLAKMADLVEAAAGSDVRVTVENYTYTDLRQNCDNFLACMQDIFHRLPDEVRRRNFGITMDVGHFNIEGDDPLVAARRIGRWCLDNDVFLRMHATDNYGDLTFSPPAYSADVHGNVSGRGINNALIIKLLRSMGLCFDVTAEQIHPLTEEDIETIHRAQTFGFQHSFEAYLQIGKKQLKDAHLEEFFDPEIMAEPAYQFLVGLNGPGALKEHLLYRRIQTHKNLSVEEAKRISQEFIRMPLKVKNDMTAYIDDFLLFIQGEYGSIKKSDFDLVCQNISGALFTAISNEHLNQIFEYNRTFRKGEVICRQKETGREMYYIKKGEVIVNIDGSCVASLGPGEIFGEMSLFYNIDRSASIVALKEGTVIGVLTRAGLETLFKSDQPFARDLISRFYNILPGRLRNLNEKYKTAIRTLHLLETSPETTLPPFANAAIEIGNDRKTYFPTLNPEEVAEIFHQTRQYDAGAYVFREGDFADGAYFILAGRVKVVAASPEGREILLAELEDGEIFGEMGLIDDKDRSATVTALTPARIAFVDKQRFHDFTQTRSPQAVRLMGFICLSLFRSILRLDQLYSDLKREIRHSSSLSKDNP